MIIRQCLPEIPTRYFTSWENPKYPTSGLAIHSSNNEAPVVTKGRLNEMSGDIIRAINKHKTTRQIREPPQNSLAGRKGGSYIRPQSRPRVAINTTIKQNKTLRLWAFQRKRIEESWKSLSSPCVQSQLG